MSPVLIALQVREDLDDGTKHTVTLNRPNFGYALWVWAAEVFVGSYLFGSCTHIQRSRLYSQIRRFYDILKLTNDKVNSAIISKIFARRNIKHYLKLFSKATITYLFCHYESSPVHTNIDYAAENQMEKCYSRYISI